MNWQAADAVMQAYRDGFTRQTVRLRTDMVFDEQELQTRGAGWLLKETLPMVEDFTSKLWGGDRLNRVKVSIVDGEVSTLLYREADNPRIDSAVLYLPGRDLVVEQKVRYFFEHMGDRLVVLSNTEQASDSWRVDNAGSDFVLASDAKGGSEVARMFKEQTYYFYQCAFNNWQMTYFRVYPHPWEIYVTSLDDRMVKIGEFESKPSFDEIVAAMEAYEKKYGITTYDKVDKMLQGDSEGVPSVIGVDAATSAAAYDAAVAVVAGGRSQRSAAAAGRSSTGSSDVSGDSSAPADERRGSQKGSDKPPSYA